MVKKALLLLAATSFFGTTYAQKCYTDEMNQQLKKAYPQIALTEAQFKAELDARLGKMGEFCKRRRTSRNRTDAR